MTAPFAPDLCGYRPNGMPSTSDSHDAGSVEWGHALFEKLLVPGHKLEVPSVGAAMESAVIDDLTDARSDLFVGRSKPAVGFQQYRHLGVSSTFTKEYGGDRSALKQALMLVEELPEGGSRQEIRDSLLRGLDAVSSDDRRVRELIMMLPEESMLRLDIAISSPSTGRLLAGISSKWSLRTDRAQDCVSQGSKLVNLRRGQMPHYAVLTMEPRPAMLKLIAYGSGAVDCVYHLALDELLEAAADLAAKRNKPDWPTRRLLERMVLQGRIRPYSALVGEVLRLPGD